MPSKNQNQLHTPLVTLMLLLAASTPDPAGRLNELGRAITSIQDAVKNVHTGLEVFHSQVMPMFMQGPKGREPQGGSR